MSAGKIKFFAICASAVSSCLLLVGPQTVFTSLVNVLLSVAVFAYPLSAVPLLLSSSVSSSISIFGLAAVFYYLLLFFLALIVRRGYKIHITRSRSLIYLLLFLVWTVICATKSATGELYFTFRMFIFIVIAWLCAEAGNAKIKNIEKVILFVAPVCLLVCVGKMLFFPEKFIIEGPYNTVVRHSIANHIGPNQFAPFVAVLGVLAFFRLLQQKRWMDFASVILSFFLLFLLKSRTSLYGAAGICFLYFIFEYRMRLKYKSIIAVAAALIVLLPAVGVFSEEKFDSSVSSDEKDLSLASLVEDAGSGRFFTWLQVFSEVFPTHPIFGIGIGRDNYQAIGLEFDSDDLYVDLLAELGFPGFCLFFLFYFKLLFEVKRSSEGKAVFYLLLIQLIFGIGETVFDSQFFWIIAMLGIMELRNGKKKAHER